MLVKWWTASTFLFCVHWLSAESPGNTPPVSLESFMAPSRRHSVLATPRPSSIRYSAMYYVPCHSVLRSVSGESVMAAGTVWTAWKKKLGTGMAMVISGWARFIGGINHWGESCSVRGVALGQWHKKVPKKKARQGKKHVKDFLWKVPCCPE